MRDDAKIIFWIFYQLYDAIKKIHNCMKKTSVILKKKNDPEKKIFLPVIGLSILLCLDT